MRLLLALLVILAGLYLWQDYQDRMIEVNAYHCAVYGKMPDCQTPLPANQRLK
jgi:hypothetical protein